MTSTAASWRSCSSTATATPPVPGTVSGSGSTRVAGILAEAPKEHARLIRHDLRYAWRVLRQHALVTTTIVLTLGLGIGANTAVFSVLNAVALQNAHCAYRIRTSSTR